MGTVSLSLPADGSTADAADYNTPINTLANEFNGNIENANIKANAAIAGSKLADGSIATAKLADDSVTDAKMDYPRFWQEIARTTLGVAGDTITVASIPARTYLKFIVKITATGGTATGVANFNNDTSTNYSERLSVNGAADTANTGAAGLIFRPGTIVSGGNSVFIAEFTNVAGVEKLGVGRGSGSITGLGDGTAPGRIETAMKWDNTSAQISEIDVTNSGTGDFAIGSEVIVLGHD